MNKDILQDYIDTCALIRESEEALKRLESRQKDMTKDSVRGSMHDFPYAAKTFVVEGVDYSEIRQKAIHAELRIQEERKRRAEQLKLEVDQWMVELPSRIQRIIRYHYFEGMTWEQTAARIGRKATGEGIRQEMRRFLKNI